MEPIIKTSLKNISSPLYDRRLMILILKKYSYGRRSFSENCREGKIKDERICRKYENVIQTKEEIKNLQDPQSPRIDDASPFGTN